MQYLLILACTGEADQDSGVSTPADPTGMGKSLWTEQQQDLDLGDRGDLDSLVSTTIYVPDSPDGTLMIFSHGFGANAEMYAETGAFLASHGMLTVMATYDVGFSNDRDHAGLAQDVSSLISAMDQLSLAYNQEKIVAAGHSRGGKQSILAAINDPRIHLVVGLDPVDALPPFGDVDPVQYPSVTPELMGELRVPIAVVGTGRGGDGSMPCAPTEENYQAYYDAANSQKLALLQPDAGHADYTDACANDPAACALCTAGDDPARTRAVGWGLMVASVAQVFGEQQYASWLKNPGSDLQVQGGL